MKYGGPVWHASAANLLTRKLVAFSAIAGVGDATMGEWIEDNPAAIHVRRRLSAEECAGFRLDVRDLRNTTEAAARLERMRFKLPAGFFVDARNEAFGA